MTEEVEKKAGELIEEVEEPLRERKEKAIESARKAERQESDSSSSVKFQTPYVVGGEKIEQYHGEKVRLKLSESLPNGKSYFDVDMPTEDSILDESHPLNRLLSLNDVDIDRIGDINNTNLPLLPVGDYNQPENMKYKIDYPPIPTIPNMALYKMRRLGIRMKLLKVRRTPYLRTNMFGDIKEVKYKSRGNAPSMSSVAYPYFRSLGIDQDSKNLVPSYRGVATSYALMNIVPSLLLFAAFGTGLITVMTATMIFLFTSLIHNELLIRSISSFASRTKKRFFPSPN